MRRFASTPHLEADPNEAACFNSVFQFVPQQGPALQESRTQQTQVEAAL